MRALEIHVNGKRVCTAGIGDAGVLTAIVRSNLGATEGQASPHISEELGLDVGGLDCSTWEHVAWNTPQLGTGDEVLIRITEVDVADQPNRSEPASTQEVTDAEKRYVERAAKRFGWTINKTNADHT